MRFGVMFQLIYVSDFAMALDENDLQDILISARAINSEQGISGKLITVSRHFFQVIEGDEAKVNQLYAKIKQDTRHENVRLVMTKSTGVREFGDWSMGFSNLLESQQAQDAAFILSDFAKRESFSPEHHSGIGLLLKQV
jgi:hypothetical protein